MSTSIQTRLIYYAKLSKPRIIWLLDLAALAGAFLVGKISVLPLIAVLLGGTLASGGSMIVNEGVEIDKDKVMKRTSKRPTVMGYISKKEAITVGAALLAIGTAIGLFANPLTSFFILLGGLIYIFVYTVWLKPRSPLNIVIGGFAGSAAAWAGYAAMSDNFTLSSLLLGMLIFMWTPGHFWSLALRYKDDYDKAGIPMLPVLLPERDAARYIAISNALMIPFALSIFPFVGIPYAIVTTIMSAILFYFTIRLLRNPTGKEAWTSFKVSAPYLAILLITVIIIKFFAII
ncbi:MULTISPECIES: heme o synthase [Acidianus]|uniref:Protoheme IX farnesyltransferase n=1 Tax=Candidatus Acidianus copahuensis TaxID=1160895 RepID=A0A031LMZ7_9CREN|nr:MULTISPECIES: heme o synthase [Acidianus]EZQ04866.1 protoheme IX farnesyltransferase [Candidatus Acidianus copahuensis]NON63172.1 protoheme IX farnesyltransferase [Acidianus sp. RZ1]